MNQADIPAGPRASRDPSKSVRASPLAGGSSGKVAGGIHLLGWRTSMLAGSKGFARQTDAEQIECASPPPRMPYHATDPAVATSGANSYLSCSEMHSHCQ